MLIDADKILEDVMEFVRQSARSPVKTIVADTKILVDLDMDSLATLELVERLRAAYGVDLLNETNSIYILRTPRSIAELIAEVLEGRREQQPHA